MNCRSVHVYTPHRYTTPFTEQEVRPQSTSKIVQFEFGAWWLQSEMCMVGPTELPVCTATPHVSVCFHGNDFAVILQWAIFCLPFVAMPAAE